MAVKFDLLSKINIILFTPQETAGAGAGGGAGAGILHGSAPAPNSKNVRLRPIWLRLRLQRGSETLIILKGYIIWNSNNVILKDTNSTNILMIT